MSIWISFFQRFQKSYLFSCYGDFKNFEDFFGINWYLKCIFWLSDHAGISTRHYTMIFLLRLLRDLRLPSTYIMLVNNCSNNERPSLGHSSSIRYLQVVCKVCTYYVPQCQMVGISVFSFCFLEKVGTKYFIKFLGHLVKITFFWPSNIKLFLVQTYLHKQHIFSM